MPMVLTEEDVNKLQRILAELLSRTESNHCLLCDTSGFVLVQEGPAIDDPLQISALGAGVFVASRELARLLGEREFNMVFHQGENKNIFIRSINAEVLLVDIFPRDASVGLVKLYSGPTVDECRIVFEQVKARGLRVAMPDSHQAFVLNENFKLSASQT